jgi:hypothetical protein
MRSRLEKYMSRKTGENRNRRLTPRQAIREHCVDCIGKASVVRDCQGDALADGPCILFKHRMGIGRPSVKLIRRFCLYCMGGSWKLVKQCPSRACSFLQYRLGKNPNVQVSEVQRRHKRELAAAARRHQIKQPKTAWGTGSFSQN